MVVDQIKKETMIIDVGILGDTKIRDKERERLRRRKRLLTKQKLF